MELVLLYLWMKLDGTIILMSVIAIIAGLLIFFKKMSNAIDKTDYPIKLEVWVYVVALILATGLPTSKQTGVLVVTHYGIKMAESDIGHKIVELAKAKANEYLDDQIEKVKK